MEPKARSQQGLFHPDFLKLVSPVVSPTKKASNAKSAIEHDRRGNLLASYDSNKDFREQQRAMNKKYLTPLDNRLVAVSDFLFTC